MENTKSLFPIFKNNPNLIFLDNASSTQKPSAVIDGIRHFFEHDYSNIHRGAYSLSERSEELYEQSKKKVKEFIGAESAHEISYTYNATYALNLLVLSLKRSKILRKGDKVLLSINEHHANIVPWLLLKEDIGIEIGYVGIRPDYSVDLEDLASKLTPDVKAVSVSHASNVTGQVFDCRKIGEVIRSILPEALYIVDASQAIQHFRVDVRDIGCDFMFFTGHKIMADTGIGVLYGKKQLLRTLKPGLGGGGAINWVKMQEHAPSGLPFRFEPGTPHIVGAVSLLRALEFIESIGGYPSIQAHESKLIEHALRRCRSIGGRARLLGNDTNSMRIGVFSFELPGHNLNDVAEYFAKRNICVRAGHHCAQPLMESRQAEGSLRMSMYIYNDTEDLDAFFDTLEEYLESSGSREDPYLRG